MIELFAAIGIVGVVITLFRVNHGLIQKNEKDIEDNEKFLHTLDKKIDILITTLSIKYPTAVKKAKKENGE